MKLCKTTLFDNKGKQKLGLTFPFDTSLLMFALMCSALHCPMVQLVLYSAVKMAPALLSYSGSCHVGCRRSLLDFASLA